MEVKIDTSHLTTDSYSRMLFYANERHKKKEPAERVVCECGKSIFRSMLQKHQQTKLHSELMRRKSLI
jgi:hypothetical protein